MGRNQQCQKQPLLSCEEEGEEQGRRGPRNKTSTTPLSL
jgi:hypothetical protein